MQIELYQKYFASAEYPTCTEADIVALEEKYKVTVPSFVREYLTQYGGGITLRKPYIRSIEDGDWYKEVALNELIKIPYELDSMRETESLLSYFYTDVFFPFANEANVFICVGIKGEYLGKIYCLYSDLYDGKDYSSMIRLLANSFVEMLEQGITTDEFYAMDR